MLQAWLPGPQNGTLLIVVRFPRGTPREPANPGGLGPRPGPARPSRPGEPALPAPRAATFSLQNGAAVPSCRSCARLQGTTMAARETESHTCLPQRSPRGAEAGVSPEELPGGSGKKEEGNWRDGGMSPSLPSRSPESIPPQVSRGSEFRGSVDVAGLEAAPTEPGD